MQTVFVRFCGGCNPEIDRRAVLEHLKPLLKKRGIKLKDLSLLDEEKQEGPILHLNGCLTGCAEKNGAPLKEKGGGIIVAGLTVNGEPVTKETIAGAILAKILGK